jgi:hypothetical protein
MPARHAGESELDQLLGERRAFSRIADSCSAADAECLRRMRGEKLYLSKNLNWAQFCSRYLDISKAEANRIIQRFEEFGQSYFDVSRMVRISPESYRAIAHAVKDKTIALTSENAQRVTAAVQALRQAGVPKREPMPLDQRIGALERRAGCATWKWIRRCFVGQVSNLRRACSPPLRHWRTLAGGRLETGRRLKTCPTKARGALRTGTLGFERFCGRIASTRTSASHTPARLRD